jgi:hypothetical protein
MSQPKPLCTVRWTTISLPAPRTWFTCFPEDLEDLADRDRVDLEVPAREALARTDPALAAQMAQAAQAAREDMAGQTTARALNRAPNRGRATMVQAGPEIVPRIVPGIGQMNSEVPSSAPPLAP